jgi:hypothetical protein
LPAPRRVLPWRLAAAALGLLVVALTLTPVTNNDLFLHLVTGRLILERHAVPSVDDYSALARGRPYVAHEWLSAVLFRLIQTAGPGEGFGRLVIAKVLLSLLLAWILLRAARHAGAGSGAALPCLAWVMCLAAARIQERPHLFAYVMLASFILILSRRAPRIAAGRTDGGAWLLLPLQILWTNLHGSFLLGPGIAALAAAGAGIERWRRAGRSAGAASSGAGGGQAAREPWRLAGLSLLLAGLCLVNPYGATLLKFPFELTGSRFMQQIYEWLPPTSEEFRVTYMARYYVVWAAGTAIVWGLALRSRRRLPPGAFFHLLVFGAFLALSLRMNRSVTDFALATLPGTAAMATVLLDRRAQAAGGRAIAPARAAVPAALAAGFAACAVYFFVAGYPYNETTARHPGLGLARTVPVAAADYVARRGLAGACVNTYSAGAYLVYRFYPALRVGMDSRNDVYGEDLYAAYEQALQDPAALAAMIERIGASFVFFEWAEPGMTPAGRTVHGLDPPWRPVWFDDRAVIYVGERGPRADLVSRDGYRVLDPMLFRPGQWSAAEAIAALPETDRAREAAGDPFIARVMRIEALRTLGRRQEADAEENRLVRIDPPLYHIWILLGLSHLERGEAGAASARLARALELNPRSTAAATALAEAHRIGG